MYHWLTSKRAQGKRSRGNPKAESRTHWGWLCWRKHRDHFERANKGRILREYHCESVLNGMAMRS
jgi:hypothetical protein